MIAGLVNYDRTRRANRSVIAGPGDKRKYRQWEGLRGDRRVPPLLLPWTSVPSGTPRPYLGRRWYYCTWLSADRRRAPAARRLAASLRSSGTFCIYYISRSPAVDWIGAFSSVVSTPRASSTREASVKATIKRPGFDFQSDLGPRAKEEAMKFEMSHVNSPFTNGIETRLISLE